MRKQLTDMSTLWCVLTIQAPPLTYFVYRPVLPGPIWRQRWRTIQILKDELMLLMLALSQTFTGVWKYRGLSKSQTAYSGLSTAFSAVVIIYIKLRLDSRMNYPQCCEMRKWRFCISYFRRRRKVIFKFLLEKYMRDRSRPYVYLQEQNWIAFNSETKIKMAST